MIEKDDATLAELVSVSEKTTDGLELLFTPLQSNDPVEQMVRRT